MLADNKLAEKAGWDREILAVELEELQIALPEIGLELGITGFDPAEVDSIMADLGEDRANPADQIPDLDDAVVVQKTRLQDRPRQDQNFIGRRPSSDFKQSNSPETGHRKLCAT
jgi:hypothetical protein